MTRCELVFFAEGTERKGYIFVMLKREKQHDLDIENERDVGIKGKAKHG